VLAGVLARRRTAVESFVQTRSAAVPIEQEWAGSPSPDGREGLRRTGIPLERVQDPSRMEFA
jgi:hypothetical protein